MRGLDLLDGGDDVLVTRDVHLQQPGAFGAQVLHLLDATGGGVDGVAHLQQAAGGVLAHAGRGAGDQSDAHAIDGECRGPATTPVWRRTVPASPAKRANRRADRANQLAYLTLQP